MTKLQQAILASLPRLNPDGAGDYLTAEGLLNAPDAHPLIAQATLAAVRGSLGHLTRQGLVVSNSWQSDGRGPRLYAVRRATANGSDPSHRPLLPSHRYT